MRLVKENWDVILDYIKRRDAFTQHIHRVLLYGPPGTGKSSWASYEFDKNVERVSLFPQMPIEDLIGTNTLVGRDGATSTVWQDGPAPRAMRKGIPLVLDEIDQYSPDVRCALHAILDDMEIAGVTLPTGERVEPKEGYLVVATMNATPDCLPEPLLDRFELVLPADQPAQGILNSVPPGFAESLKRRYASLKMNRWAQTFGVRSVQAVLRLSNAIDQEQAAQLVWGEKGVDILASCVTADPQRQLAEV
jgi:MoxR-like ATPase